MDMTAEDFNTKHPVGTEVLYWPVLPEGPNFPPRRTKTRTPAWELGHGAPVVSVVGQTGYDNASP